MTKARELLLTGDDVDEPEAARIGMVNKVVPVAWARCLQLMSNRRG